MISHKDYQDLIKDLNHHAKRYYQDDSPEISDHDYDLLYQTALKFEESNPLLRDPSSPTQRIGDKPLEKFESFTHSQTLPSLGNAFGKDDLIAFHDRIQKGLETQNTIPYTVEPKIDGLAVAIHYKKGKLDIGATRGDGKTGENVTENLKTIRSLPLTLSKPIDIEVRGEVYIRKSQFKKIAHQFANPRNAAAGAMRQLDSTIARDRHLDIWIYHGIHSDIDTQSKMIQFLDALGLPTNPGIKTVDSIEEALTYCQELENTRNNFDYEIDGAVIKVDKISYQDQLGSTIKAPRWAIAYKFKAEEGITQLLDITVQVGRTGVLTPVAHLSPIKLAGVTIERSTLHNMDEITRLDVQIGDDVVILRSGEVIPKIIRRQTRHQNSIPFVMPIHCPICSHLVHKEEEEVATKCINIVCPARIKGQLTHFASRKAMDIEGLGEAVIDLLVDEQLVSRISDVFKLQKAALLPLERFAEKSADNLIVAIEAAKQKPLSNLIFSFGISFVGENAATLLADQYGNLDAITQTNLETLTGIDGIGDKTAQSVLDTFLDPDFQKELDTLKSLGLNPTQIANTEGTLNGLTFLITGTLSSLKRHEAEAKIKENGGKVTGTVSQKLTHLIVGDSPGSKLEKAEKINIKTPDKIQIITEENFQDLL